MRLCVVGLPRHDGPMSSTDPALGVYSLATDAMVHALAHDRGASEGAYARCLVLLARRDTGAVGDALTSWRTALDAGEWAQVSTALWQLMCSLPVGFPPDQSTLPPPAGASPLVLRPCPEHGAAPAGVWWRFCPSCGRELVADPGQ